MNESKSAEPTGKAQPNWVASNALARVLQVAWMSIALGVGMELATVVVQGCFNKLPEQNPILADTVQKVSWSTLVCVGLGIGTVAGKLRSRAMGILGAISAPLGFTVARSTHKSAQQVLSVISNDPAPTAALLASQVITKGLEYAVLGVLLGLIPKTRWDSFGGHLLVGLGCAVVFGGALVGEALWLGNPPPVKLAVAAVNELIFPMGCALVIFFSRVLAREITPPT